MTSSGAMVEAALQGHTPWDKTLELLQRRGTEERWLLSEAQVQVDRVLLGEGGSGHVLRASFLGNSVALKVAKPLKTPEDTIKMQASLLNEIRLLRNLRHTNIVRFYGVVLYRSSITIAGLVCELVEGEDLDKYMISEPATVERYELLGDVGSALRFLHSLSVVHGDVKPSNVMVDLALKARPVAKLVDFGFSRAKEKNSQVLGGSLRWKAPEVNMGQAPQRESDIFSFAYLIYFCVTDKIPWGSKTFEEMQTDSASGPSPLHFDDESAELQALIWRMLDMNPAQRPQASAVCSSLLAFKVEETDVCRL